MMFPLHTWHMRWPSCYEKEREGGWKQPGPNNRVHNFWNGGVALVRKLRRSNPWKRGKCGWTNCFFCREETGGDCWREGVDYILVCKESGDGVPEYLGDCKKQLYQRARLEQKKTSSVKTKCSQILARQMGYGSRSWIWCWKSWSKKYLR